MKNTIQNSYNEQKLITVLDFANELGLPAWLVLNIYAEMNYNKKYDYDLINESDEIAFFEHLRKEHSSLKTTIKNIDPQLEALQRINAEKLSNELTKLNDLQVFYFSMPLQELENIWQKGKNENLEEIDYKVIRAALREKLEIK